jgi:hypothetical protein
MGSIISNLAMPNRISSRYFKTSPEIIEFAFMPYVRFPLSLKNEEDLLHSTDEDDSYGTV